MTQAQNGDTVKVHYRGKFDDGTVFESTFNNDPIQFVIGQGERIPGFEQALVGMSPGDRRTTPKGIVIQPRDRLQKEIL